MPHIIDTSLLDTMIVGRVNPYIYAFSTETVPNYLKVGDTYRPVSTRLTEWRQYYPNLIQRYSHTAMLDSGNIFRDYAVHSFLEIDKGLHRLQPEELEQGIYYSREFFQNAQPSDIDEAIEDIQSCENEGSEKYKLYTATADHLPVRLTYPRDKSFDPRNNQQEAIDKFVNAVASGRTNLLMYAVMRFGKSFTAMCCATEIHAKFVLIVSAKADVRKEWKETVESHIRFDGFKFFDGEDLRRNNSIISTTLNEGGKVALFLTLQDLQGSEIKNHHQEIFSSTIDLLIVDETHFGARASEYGKVLQYNGLRANELRSEIQNAETSDEISEELKTLHATIRLHLSGTPYRILMGDEFTKDDIIAFCQYTDIVDAKEKWDYDNILNDDEPEWKNPYYGFPQMVRFAFHPNDSSIRRMREMRDNGITFAFSALFKPVSLIKTPDNQHKRFINEREILELMEVIDGSRSDENLLGFLDYDKIKEGKMCRHIVCVLPYRASCDALESLLIQYSERFRNLSQYTIVNIAGVDDERTYEDTDDVKKKIKACEENGEKTITLTVNRMLTGSTVREWDTMLYFKDTASPQEYDQAIFRIQNQYIRVYKDELGNEIRYNMKPQTLLVDFDPDRMFRMQELKSQFYNVNTERNGNDKLQKRIERELVISPIITLNHNQLKQVEATDVMAVVQQYSQNKSIIDEATDIPYDFSLLDNADFRTEIESMKEIDAAKGLEFSPNEGDGDSDYTIPTEPTDENPNNGSSGNGSENSSSGNDDDEQESISKKLAAYYSKILFYAFLTETEVKSLDSVIHSIADGNMSNRRIAKNLGLKVPILWLIQNKCNPFILSKLDYKIQNINMLMRDERIEPLQRAKNAMTRFARVSDSEVVTPTLLADELISLIPEEDINAQTKILDISTVQGELVCALKKKYGDIINANVVSIPTSPLTYELTRKIYKLLDLPVENVKTYYSYDLIQDTNNELVEELVNDNYSVVLGVPPFRERRGGGRGDGGSAIYHLFFNLVKDNLNPRYIAMMMQSTWYTGGRGELLPEFREYMLSDEVGNRHIKEFHDYPNVETYIKGVTTLRGGLCLFLWDANYDGDCLFINKINHHDYPMRRMLRYSNDTYRADFLIRWNKGLSILQQVLDRENSFIPDNGMMRKRNAFGFPNEGSDNWLVGTRKTKLRKTLVYLAKGKTGYAKDSEFTKEHDGLLMQWKVLIAKSSSGGDELPHLVISEPIVSGPGSATANTHYVIECDNDETKARNLASYMRTKFFRFMVNLLRSNQNMRVDMYQFAPRLDFSRTWTDEDLYSRYELSPEDVEFIDLIIKDMNLKNR